jgi:hypothetical protein
LFVLTGSGAKQLGSVILRVGDKELWALRTAFEAELTPELPPLNAEDKRVGEIELGLVRELLKHNGTAMMFFAPRGMGLSAWNNDARKQTQIRRRFMLLGETMDSARVWDIRRACQALRLLPQTSAAKLELNAAGQKAVNGIYASLFEKGIDRLRLTNPAASHRSGPDYLNVLRVLDVPQAVAMAAERSNVRIISEEANSWNFPAGVASRLGWSNDRFTVESSPAGQSQ